MGGIKSETKGNNILVFVVGFKISQLVVFMPIKYYPFLVFNVLIKIFKPFYIHFIIYLPIKSLLNNLRVKKTTFNILISKIKKALS